MLRPHRLDLLHLRLPLLHFFETSFGRVDAQETLLVRVEADGLVGWGECPASAGPFYSSETVVTCRYVLREFLVPLLRAHPVSDPTECGALFRGVRGHRMAKAGLEMALWDLRARREGRPLSALYGGNRKRIESGVSLGIEDRVEDLLARVGEFIARGYRRIKVKIKPGWDLAVLESLRERFPDVPLMADANSAYTLDDLAHLKRLDAFRLMMVEQPLAYEDIVDHRRLQAEMATPICLDESIHSADDARRALELGSCRIINIKQARVGGPTEARRLHDVCARAGAPVWCGGLLESGVGRAHNVAISSLPGFTLPGDVSGSDRYWKEDVVEPPVLVAPDGTIQVPTGPGLGYEVVEERVARWTVAKETLE
ncbi:MAG: o-succinylbenzoate synthase [Planctomycetes bacterium]|nr:o-succinylbenzoate synthase [Planctomycetota bacterium]